MVKTDYTQVIPTQSTRCHVFNDVTMVTRWRKRRSDSARECESASCATCTYNTPNTSSIYQL